MEKSKQPLSEGAVINGNEGHNDSYQNNKKNERVFEDSGDGQAINDDSQDNTSGQLEELLESHVSDQTEFVGGNILRNRVLF